MNNFFTNRRILVTGGTGFVGSHLVEALIHSGARVVVLSRSMDPYGYFASQQLQERSIVVDGDVKDQIRMFDIVSRYEISYIYHLAAQPLVTTALVNPSETLTTNIIGTVNILEAARRSPWIEGVLVASSDKAYGKLDRPYQEDDPLKGDHPYEVSKSSADLIAQSYAVTYNLPVAITRFGNIFGEGDTNPSRVIPGILFSMLQNEPFRIRSNGQYKRAYVYVKDVVNGYLLLAEHINDCAGQAFNFGSENIYSVLDLISIFESTMGLGVPYEILNTAINEIPFQSLSSEKALSKLSWQADTMLADTIPSLYAWYKSYITKLQHIVEKKIPASSSTIFSVS